MKVDTKDKTIKTGDLQLKFYPSFAPYIRFLRLKMEHSPDVSLKFYRYIIAKFERHPELSKPLTDLSILKDQEELIQFMRMSLMPLAADSEDFLMALAFMEPFTIFYATDPFKNLLLHENVDFNSREDKVQHLHYYLKLVLERGYGLTDIACQKIIKQVYNKERHLVGHHHIKIDSRFLELQTVGPLPTFKEEWLDLFGLSDTEFLEKVHEFPFQKFSLEGFCVLNVEDISYDVALNQLKNAILNIYADPLEVTMAYVEKAIAELLGDSRVKIGVTPFFKVNGKLIYDRSLVTKCLVISTSNTSTETEINVKDVYKRFQENPQPLILSKVDAEVIAKRPYLHELLLHKVKSFMAYPIYKRGGLMGVFEVGSVQEEFISHKTVEQLQQVFPLIADLIYFLIKSFEENIDKLIKDKFTSLQPSVEWKFNEVAAHYLVQHPNKGSDEEIENVVFPNVHPLYGAIDVRNSSLERSSASRKDYQYQLNTTLELLNHAATFISLPLLEQLRFRCSELITTTKEILTAEDELIVNDFLVDDISSFLHFLTGTSPQFENDISDYINKSDEVNGGFFANRSAYESSLKKINNSVVNFLEEEVGKLQQVYPFYFEKYRSDGVEYNIYIGQAIVPGKIFDPQFLKNLRLWQLNSMAHVAVLNHEMLGEMLLPLQTTQLILVHTHTIDISFRKDERRFDVEGSYNIRYEIIKKRIDKVKIKDTPERLTQPGTIAIVYTNAREVEEYIEHINLLQSNNILQDGIEMLDLEELQGVRGLKALRVSVKFLNM